MRSVWTTYAWQYEQISEHMRPTIHTQNTWLLMTQTRRRPAYRLAPMWFAWTLVLTSLRAMNIWFKQKLKTLTANKAFKYGRLCASSGQDHFPLLRILHSELYCFRRPPSKQTAPQTSDSHNDVGTWSHPQILSIGKYGPGWLLQQVLPAAHRRLAMSFGLAVPPSLIICVWVMLYKCCIKVVHMWYKSGKMLKYSMPMWYKMWYNPKELW